MQTATVVRARRNAFLVTPASLLSNPFYILRRGLFRAIGQLAPRVQGEILDFGCGSKPYESLFVNSSRYIGVDIQVSGHDHRDSKVDVFYDGRTLPFRDAQFDAVVSFEVLEHVFNIDVTLCELRRVLRTDGRLLLSIPFAWDEHEAPYDFARYTSYGIDDILRRNGFDIVEKRKTTTYVLAIGQLFIAYLFQHVLPRGQFAGRLSQLIVIFPLTAALLALDAVLPKRYEYFSGLVVLAQCARRPGDSRDGCGSDQNPKAASPSEPACI